MHRINALIEMAKSILRHIIYAPGNGLVFSTVVDFVTYVEDENEIDLGVTKMASSVRGNLSNF